jgi:hypothetical protein
MSRALGALGEITEAFAAAAVDPTRWGAAMDAAARATSSFGAILVPVTGRLPVFPISDGMQAAVETYLRDGWISRDARDSPQPAFFQRGVATEFDFTTPEKMARDPYYQEFLRPHKLRWYGGVRVGARHDLWCLSIQRSIEQGPFGPHELERLSSLSHRLAGAAELARAFGFARIESALAAFEASHSPVAAIDRFGEVLRLNPGAAPLLGDDLKVIRRLCRDGAQPAQEHLPEDGHARARAAHRAPHAPGQVANGWTCRAESLTRPAGQVAPASRIAHLGHDARYAQSPSAFRGDGASWVKRSLSDPRDKQGRDGRLEVGLGEQPSPGQKPPWPPDTHGQGRLIALRSVWPGRVCITHTPFGGLTRGRELATVLVGERQR